MKIKFLLALLIAAGLLAGCKTLPAAGTTAVNQPAGPTQTPKPKEFKTAIGELALASARFVDEVNGVKPYAGCKLLLVFFNGVDPANFDLSQFQGMQNKFLIRGEDGSETIGTMAGMVDENFAIGFQAPETIKTYTLIWPDNETTNITDLIRGD